MDSVELLGTDEIMALSMDEHAIFNVSPHDVARLVATVKALDGLRVYLVRDQDILREQRDSWQARFNESARDRDAAISERNNLKKEVERAWADANRQNGYVGILVADRDQYRKAYEMEKERADAACGKQFLK